MSMGSSDEPQGIDAIGALYDPVTQANPHPMLAKLRAQGPVVELMPGFVQAVGRAASDTALRNNSVFSSVTPTPIGGAHRPLIPIQLDPPLHKAYRNVLDPIFAPRVVNPMIDPITDLINEHIDAVIGRGECIFDHEIAVPFPSQVFLTVAGLPLTDLEFLLKLKDGILRPGYNEGLAPDDVEGRNKINAETVEQIYTYFQAAIDDRRATPRDDMMTLFTTTEVEGKKLSDSDILDTCFLFLIAGLDTVTDSLTLMFVHLAQHPEIRQQIVDDPDLIPTMVEELLRYETPVGAVYRLTSQDTDIQGVPIPAGTMVVVNLASANTDPAFLPDADVVRLDREANPHYAFGGGVHRCLGSHLARRELQIVLREWHRRIPDYEIKPGTELIWPPGLRSVENIHLTWPA
jgi:cytochrome P450